MEPELQERFDAAVEETMKRWREEAERRRRGKRARRWENATGNA